MNNLKLFLTNDYKKQMYKLLTFPLYQLVLVICLNLKVAYTIKYIN